MTKLTMIERDVWFSVARAISKTGLSPSQQETGDDTNRDYTNISRAVSKLVRYGYLEKTGSGKTLTLHVLVWPDHIQPRETEGRTDGQDVPAMPARRAPQTLGRMPDFPRSAASCATPGCRLTRQPGRAHCAACINQRLPGNPRGNMTDVFETEICT